LAIEQNIVELVPKITDYGPPFGIFLGIPIVSTPPLFRQILIRDNVIRHVDNIPDPLGTYKGMGIFAAGCGELIVEDNVIDLDHVYPIQFRMCGKVRFFANQTSRGLLVQGYEQTTQKYQNELTTDVAALEVVAI
jgi:hypothetical protein